MPGPGPAPCRPRPFSAEFPTHREGVEERKTVKHLAALFVALLTGVSFVVIPAASPLSALAHRPAHGAAKQGAAIPNRCPKRIKPKGTIKFSDWQFPDTLNLYQTQGIAPFEIDAGTQEGIFLFDNQGRLRVDMAETIPTIKNGGIKNGGKQFVLHLKKGIRWSNGAEITSKDVKFGWQVGMDKSSGPFCSGSCDVISSIATPDKYTVVFKLKSSYAPFLSAGTPPVLPSSWPNAWSNNPHDAALKVFQDTGFNYEGPSFPTNGAYQVVDFVPNDRVVLHPMKYYAILSCGAHFANSIFAFYSDKPGMIAAAASGDTDVTQNYTNADLPDLLKHKGAFKTYTTPSFNLDHFVLNVDATYNGKPNPLHNTKVRQALALGLDKLGLIQSSLGVSAKIAKGIIAWSFLVNTKTLKQPFADTSITGQWDPLQKKYDPNTGRGKALADAKKLLSQTSFADGFTLDFFTTSGNPVRVAEESVMAASWLKLGVQVNASYVPASKLFASYGDGGIDQRGEFQVVLHFRFGVPDPDYFKYEQQSKYIDREQTVHSIVNANESGIHDILLDKYYTLQARTLDTKLRAKYWAAIQVRVNQQAYWIPLFFRPAIVTSNGKVANFSNNPTTYGPEWNMSVWRGKSG
jgi:ABC-type transport system substrate-binding protein